MKKLLTLFAVSICFAASAQMFEVVAVKQLQMGNEREIFHPTFTPDGKSLIVSDEAYNGLGIITLDNLKYRHLTDMQGAGYKYRFGDNNTIICRQNNYKKETVELFTLDIPTKTTKLIMEDLSHFNNISVKDGNATVFANGKKIDKRFSNKVTTKSTAKDLLITEEDLRIVLYNNGVRTEVDPFPGEPDNQYVWTSLSPDQTKILFSTKNKTYVCNLDGSNVVLLGDFRAPVWMGNDFVVGMQDADDGYFFTSSDIVVADVNGKRFQQLTSPSDEIKMFPSVSPDGKQVAYHTLNGKIYIMTLKQK
ncbi:MAG TPA: hypothetical protein PLS09_05060 [Paludibacteraceae bacterium]|nr:hypothetical protein [Paludibacteraceae bacterium]